MKNRELALLTWGSQKAFKNRSISRQLKRIFLSLLLALTIILMLPISLRSASVAIKLSLGQGWPQVSEINQILHSWQESLKIQAETLKSWTWEAGTLQEYKQQIEFAASLEFSLSRYFSLNLTSGYTYGERGQDQIQAIIDRPVGRSLYIQQVKIATLPLCLEALFHLPFSSRWEIYGGGGGGWLWLNFTQREGIQLEQATSFTYPTEINAEGSTRLLKTSLGLVCYLQDISLFVEGNYVWAKFDQLNGEDKNGQEGQLYYLREYQPETGYWEARHMIAADQPASPEFQEVRPARLDLSGFSLRLGLKIKF